MNNFCRIPQKFMIYFDSLCRFHYSINIESHQLCILNPVKPLLPKTAYSSFPYIRFIICFFQQLLYQFLIHVIWNEIAQITHLSLINKIVSHLNMLASLIEGISFFEDKWWVGRKLLKRFEHIAIVRFKVFYGLPIWNGAPFIILLFSLQLF